MAITGGTVTPVLGTNVTTGLIGNATTSDVTIASGSGTGLAIRRDSLIL